MKNILFRKKIRKKKKKEGKPEYTILSWKMELLLDADGNGEEVIEEDGAKVVLKPVPCFL